MRRNWVSGLKITMSDTDRDSESVSHQFFKAKNGWMTPIQCESCRCRHKEKFWVELLGGWDEARKGVEMLAKKMEDRGE
jgi:hypothetical protein